MRGFDGVLTANEFADWLSRAVLWGATGKPPALMEPNWIPFPPVGFPPTEPPLIM